MGQATGAVHGYLVADQARNDSGKFSGLAYIVNEIPVPPQTDNPAPANPPLVNTELLVGTEKAARGHLTAPRGEDGIFDQVATFSSIHSRSSIGASESLAATSAATMDSSNIPPGLLFTKRLCKGFEADALTSDFLAAARGQLRGYPWGNVTLA